MKLKQGKSIKLYFFLTINILISIFVGLIYYKKTYHSQSKPKYLDYDYNISPNLVLDHKYNQFLISDAKIMRDGDYFVFFGEIQFDPQSINSYYNYNRVYIFLVNNQNEEIERLRATIVPFDEEGKTYLYAETKNPYVLGADDYIIVSANLVNKDFNLREYLENSVNHEDISTNTQEDNYFSYLDDRFHPYS